MNITPLEIRQKTFEKHFRGYDKDEVTSFLATLSKEWEKLMDEKKELQIKLDNAEKEASKLKEVESSLYRTLKAAEDTGASIIEQATATGDQILKESQTDAALIQSDAKQRSQNMIEVAENKAKEIMSNLKRDLEELIGNYENLVQQRKKLISNLKDLASTTFSSVDDAEKAFHLIDIKSHTELLEDLSEGGSLEKLVEEKFQEAGAGIQQEPVDTGNPTSSDVIIIDHTNKPEYDKNNGNQTEDDKKRVKEEPTSDTHLSDEPTAEEEKEAAIKEAEKQFKVHESKPSYFDERSRSAMTRPSTEKKNQSGSFFDQFE
ncbi:DivIVA domain-containing protein [Anditalea andensis]|uniref:Cell division protein DivIVA n=1 Tax=Anditalea andensis TaxID=1048983 RepID=A0A074KXX3_9BACT|nr:DivIVA domain-containing protein [Anditalea andensis]KEO74826.1 hypothetical protein EL17_03870 [Anditalea andensis]